MSTLLTAARDMSPGRPASAPAENVGNVWSRCITALIGFGVRSATNGLFGTCVRVLALGIQRDETEAIADQIGRKPP